MKKAFAALLILSMLLTAVATAEAASVTGTWYLVEMSDGQTSYNPASLGMSITMELKDDGTAIMGGIGDEPTQGTWKADGDSIVVTDDTGTDVSFTMADGKLSADQDGMTMVFSQEEPEADNFAPAAPVEAAEEDFAGSWTAYKIGMEGVYYDASILASAFGGDSADITAVIEGSKVTLNGFLFSNTEIPLTYADGKMSFSATSDDDMVAAITAQLLEDGMLSLEMEGNGSSFAFYMNKAE